MTHSTLSVQGSRFADKAAFRSVFADPGELLIAVVMPSAKIVAKAAAAFAQSGGRARWIVFSDDAVRKEEGPVHVLDSWALSLLPELATVVDALILAGPCAQELPAEAPIVVATAEQASSAEGLFSALRLTPAQKTTDFVLYNDWGIGDELLLSAVAREVTRARPETRVWIRSRYGFRFPSYVRTDEPPAHAKRVETIYQNATLYGPGAHSPFPGHLVQQMLDKFYVDTGLTVEARDVRPELALRRSPPTRRPRSVVLHSRPNPRLPSKDWGLARWEKLSELLHASGVALIQVGAAEEPALPHAEDLRGIPLGEVPEVVAGAGATVCVVGFLMHVAAATRTPAVVIYGGREHPAIDGYPDQVHLSSGPLPCRGRWGCHLGPDIACPHEMRCMDGLTPELVASEVLSLFEEGP